MAGLNVKTWEGVYSEGRSLLIWPDETVVSSLNKYNGKLKKGIDLACGAGRHTILMSQMGIESIGIDSSQSSIDFAQKRSKKMGLNNIVFINSLVQEIEFEKGGFDVIIAWGLIHYLKKENQKTLLNKIYHTLKSNGLFLLTLRSIQDSRRSTGIKIEGNRYLVDYFNEDTNQVKQTKMYFWSEKEVMNLLKGFAKINLGHRVVEPIGQLGTKSAHWLVEAFK